MHAWDAVVVLMHALFMHACVNSNLCEAVLALFVHPTFVVIIGIQNACAVITVCTRALTRFLVMNPNLRVGYYRLTPTPMGYSYRSFGRFLD
jgi:hypothetical protein